MTTLASRVKKAMDAAGVGVTELANACGIKAPSVSGWLNGDTKTMKAATGHRAAAFLKVNFLWLTEGKGKMNSTDEETEAGQSPTDEEFAFVKQLDLQASCGNGRFTDHVVVKGGLAFKRTSLRHLGVQEEQARIVYADGTSMEPTIGHGRVVLVNLSDNVPIDGKVYLICDPDGAAYLKRLVREYHPTTGVMAWIMRSDNPNKKEFPDKLLPDDPATVVVGRAVWNDNTL